ncbi:putative splicing factor U2af large subunit B-like [Capsicum annuum]|nr:putative splicing factor U2af large subunit B-like [Capsicum annuum]
MLEGFQNLVIPIHNYTSTKSEENLVQKSSSPKSYCWLTQEDVARFLLNSVGVFSPTRTFSIESLNIIDRKFMTVGYHDPAISALDLITLAHTEQTSVAVVDDDRRLIEEISGSKLAYCDEDVAAEIMTLSCGDLMAYINCGGPPEDLIGLVRTRLQEKKLGLMMELMDEESPVPSTSSSASCCSSDDESRLSRNGSSGRSSARRSEAITCYPGSSLAAVLILKHLHIVRVPFGSSMRMITI